MELLNSVRPQERVFLRQLLLLEHHHSYDLYSFNLFAYSESSHSRNSGEDIYKRKSSQRIFCEMNHQQNLKEGEYIKRSENQNSRKKDPREGSENEDNDDEQVDSSNKYTYFYT